MKAERKPILVKFAVGDLARLDAAAAEAGMTRMGLIVESVLERLEKGVPSEVEVPRSVKAKKVLAVAELAVGVEPVVPEAPKKPVGVSATSVGPVSQYFDGQGRERAGARLKGTGFFQRGRKK